MSHDHSAEAINYIAIFDTQLLLIYLGCKSRITEMIFQISCVFLFDALRFEHFAGRAVSGRIIEWMRG
jgi:hypothetical protein